jgi:uncharacterized protein YjbJ (UPF0337 family)
MKGTTNVVKGRIKEAAGALTGNNKLRTQGQADQVLGHIEQAADKGVKKAQKAADGIMDRAKDAADREVARERKLTGK